MDVSFWQVYQLAMDAVMLCNKPYKSSVADYNQLLLTYFMSSQLARCSVDLDWAQSPVAGKGWVSPDLGWGSAAWVLAGCPLALAGAGLALLHVPLILLLEQWATPGLSFS